MARTIAKDHKEKRRMILHVAAEVFARDGIARASMNQVAQSCGISKANIYHYYDSKDALVFDILDAYLSELHDRVAAAVDATDRPEDQLHALLCEYLLAYEGMDHQHKIQAEGLPRLPQELQRTLKAYQKQMVIQMSNILDRVSGGRLGKDPKLLRETTMSVFGMLNWFYMWHPKANRDDRTSYSETIAKLTLRGLPGL